MQNFNTITIFGFVNNGKTEFSKYLGTSKHLDAFKEQKTRKMTIQIGQTYMFDGSTNYLILDTPGHAVLTSKVIVGLSLANIPICIVSALPADSALLRLSFFTELLHKLRVNKFICVISKTDCVSESQLSTFKVQLSTALAQFTTYMLSYHMHMDKDIFMPQLYSALNEFSNTKNTCKYKENLVIRSFNPNLAQSSMSHLCGAVLGVWGTETCESSMYLAPLKVDKKHVVCKLEIVKVLHQHSSLAKTVETNLSFHIAHNNACIGSILCYTEPTLHYILWLPVQRKIYEKNELLILVIANMELFAKVRKITTKPNSICVDLERPVPDVLLCYTVHLCKRIGYAWTLVEAHINAHI